MLVLARKGDHRGGTDGCLGRLACLAIGVALALSIWLAPAVPVAGAAVVRVKDDFFSPARLRVERGDRVIWRWRGRSAHNVVGAGWRSRTMRRGSYARKFRRVGTYRYLCTLHPRMRGRIVVRS